MSSTPAIDSAPNRPFGSDDPRSDTTDAPAAGRRERRIAATRRTILDEARALFVANGFNSTTVEQIAEAADVAQRTLFRYFPTKSSLLFADFDDVREQMLERLEASPAEEDPLVSLANALAWLGTTVAANLDDIVWGFRLCVDQGVDGPSERHLIKEQTDRRIAEFLAERLGVCVDEDPRPTAWANSTMAVFVVALRRAAKPTTDESTAVPEFQSLLRSTATTFGAVAAALD